MGKKHEAVAGAIVAAEGPWRELLLVCRKCAAKGKRGGFGPDGRDTLPAALRDVLRAQKRRREVRVGVGGCLGGGPNGAVPVRGGAVPGALLGGPRGTDAAVLLGETPPPA